MMFSNSSIYKKKNNKNINKPKDVEELQELYTAFKPSIGLSTKKNIIPKITQIPPSVIIIKKGSTDSNSRRYLSILSIIAKKKYSSKIKNKAIVKSPYVNNTSTF